MAASKEQLPAIEHKDGPMMVLAGPGSGKTFTITRRIQYLIEHHGVSPEQILVITFTKAAAVEMKERFEQLIGDDGQNVTFGTFHAVYFQILKRSYHYDYSNIITEKEKREYLKEILFEKYGDESIDDSFIPLLLAEFSYIKNYGITPEEFDAPYLPEGDFQSVFLSYRKKMQINRKLDFDDMVLMCFSLLKSQPGLLDMWREMYRYIMIDEFQDINRMQYEVVRLLAMPENNLFVVGDDDQSIYGFRGSDPSIMLGFPMDYPGCRKVMLNDNYRCTRNIVQNAVQLIGHNKNRYSKALKARKDGHSDVIATGFPSKEAEMDEIVSLLKHYHKYGSYNDIAVLFRTNLNASFLAQKLTREKIPFRQKEQVKNLFEEPSALDILAILHFAHGHKERRHFLRFMNKPVRYIRRDMVHETVDLEEMIRRSGMGSRRIADIRKLIYDLKQIEKMDPYAAINYIRKGMGYEYWLVKDAEEKHREKEEDVRFLDWLQSSAKDMETFEAWLDMIGEYGRNLREQKQDTGEAVSLVTMHGSKGLEYRVVIIPDLNEGNVPQKRAITPKEIEEERRLLYVAMTRAREKLFLFYVKKTKENRLVPSRFLKEIKVV